MWKKLLERLIPTSTRSEGSSTSVPSLLEPLGIGVLGDWETAIGAASHVGRRDILEYLMSKGARPDIFTLATLGNHAAVKAIVAASPGVQTIAGPHGISLLQHARAGLRMEEVLSERERRDSNALIAYLEELGDAGSQDDYSEVKESDKAKYLGDYKYGTGADDGFVVTLNMRKMLLLKKMGKFAGGGTLYQIGESRFSCNGTKTAEISFSSSNGSVSSLTIREPNLTLTATKVRTGRRSPEN